VPLDPQDRTRRSIGTFTYAGGVEIRSADVRTFLELSDLRVVSGDRLLAVGDEGTFFEARLLFDETAQLSGLADVHVRSLVDELGEPVDAANGDAEGVELLPNGDRLVAFESRDRVWLYPADGSAPRSVPMPDAVFPPNEGMEAITRFPAGGPDAYLIGAESGTIWLCTLSASCTESGFGILVPSGFGLTALSSYGEQGDFAILSRSYDTVRGARISVRLIETKGAPEGRVLDEMTMAAPLTVDNFEGIAAVARPSGGMRLFLVSDDNGSPAQRTYLLAFDWRPAR
jgi:hypothetical protein